MPRPVTRTRTHAQPTRTLLLLAACALALGQCGCHGGRVQKLKSLLASTATALTGPSAASAARKPTGSQKPRVPLGVNLGGIVYYSTSMPFTDAMKMADTLHSHNATDVPGGRNAYDSELAGKIPCDENGYPLEIPFNVPGAEGPQILEGAIATAIYAGQYTLLYDGDGDIEFLAGSARVLSKGPGRMLVQVERRSELILFAITRSARANHLRNVRFFLPGFDPTSAPKFHPDFLARLRGVDTLRFMDWGRVNGSDVEHWRQRATPDMSQGTGKGVAFENMIDLANEVDADAWICVPHKADDDFVEQLAKLVKARLSPKHRVYVEYSNELWNSIFPQLGWSIDHGCAVGVNDAGPYSGACNDGGPRFWAGLKWNARRSGQIFKTFEKVFDDKTRVVRVLAGQSSNESLNESLLTAFYDARVNPAGGEVDAFAVAPYLGAELAQNIGRGKQRASITPAEIVERLGKRIDEDVVKHTATNKVITNHFGARLIAYEGGQHLVAFEELQNDEAYTQKLVAANREPSMRGVYDAMLDAWWKASDNDLMMLFTYIDKPGKFGSWGMLEEQTEPTERAPKFRAFSDRLTKLRGTAMPSPQP